MIARGIQNTKADFWLHLFPLEARLYWYAVRHMRTYLEARSQDGNIGIIGGHSKNGAQTGKGYLVSKTLPFVTEVVVPDRMISAFDWVNGNDRQVGLLWGEQVIDWMGAANLLRIPFFSTTRLSSRKDQYDIGDFGVEFHMPRCQIVEVKTERVHSANLFVQTHEGGHRVTLVKRGNSVENVPTEAPGFEF